MKGLHVRELEQECLSFDGKAFYYPQTYNVKYKLKTKCHACGKRSHRREVLFCDGRLISVCPRCGDRQAVPMEYLRLLDRRRNNWIAWICILLSLVGLGLLFALLYVLM